MDIKKKDLNPDLKAIYERVMNTTVSGPQSNPIPTQQPTQVPTPMTQTPPPPPTTLTQTTEGAPNESNAVQPQISTTVSGAPETPENSGIPFLSSLPPRPLNSTISKPFIFSSKNKPISDKKEDQKNDTSTQQNDTVPNVKKSGMLSSKIIYLLGGVFLVVYSLFWLKVFNIF